MRKKFYFSRYMSKVLFMLLYLMDIFFLYYLTGDICYTTAGGLGIFVILAIQTGISLMTLKAHSLKHSPMATAQYLQSCMDEVMRRSVAVRRKQKKIRLWIADNESLNCFAVGQNIVVNKSMLRLGDRSMLEGCLSHELSHVYNMDSAFTTLLELNLFIGLCTLCLVLFGAGAGIVLVISILFSVFFSSWAGFTAGSISGKLLKFCFGLITRAFYYISKLFSAFLYRRQEFEADRYAALLGYSQAMINLFQLEERTEHHAVQTSWIEDLLNDHPSNYRRIIQFEKIEEEIARIQPITTNNSQIIPYQNPFR